MLQHSAPSRLPIYTPSGRKHVSRSVSMHNFSSDEHVSNPHKKKRVVEQERKNLSLLML